MSTRNDRKAQHQNLLAIRKAKSPLDTFRYGGTSLQAIWFACRLPFVGRAMFLLDESDTMVMTADMLPTFINEALQACQAWTAEVGDRP